jgi:NADPH:quinone reductase-like Zn-dependent oxidoreductase
MTRFLLENNRKLSIAHPADQLALSKFPIAGNQTATNQLYACHYRELCGSEDLGWGKGGVIHMKAVRIHRFGPPEVVVIEEIPKPSAGKGEVLVRVAAAGVAPWDALIREGKSKVSPQPPLTLGSDLSGLIEAVGPDVSQFGPGDEVYGVTNPQFCGAQAEFAVALAGMVAQKPRRLNYLEAASAPVIAVTAWQMLFEYAQAKSGDTILITGAAGNVGAYAVQMALQAGIRVIAVARSSAPGSPDLELLRGFGVETIVDSNSAGFETSLPQVDAVLDTVGGDTVQRCSAAVKPGGRLVSVVSPQLPQRAGMQSVFFYAEVTSERLRTITELFESRMIGARVGSVLPLAEARSAHEMLAGAPHQSGKIVLQLLG